MSRLGVVAFSAAVLGASCLLVSCTSRGLGSLAPSLLPPRSGGADSATLTPIHHIVIVIHENRSFDNLFGRFPGADGATSGKMSNGQRIELRAIKLTGTQDLGHSWVAYREDYDHGKMDGFNLENGGKAEAAPYTYVDPGEITPYWDIAKSYVLADHMFQTQGSGSFTAHQDLIRGGTGLDATRTLIDFPSHTPWGCDAPNGTTTSVLTVKDRYYPFGGPFPCLSYRTLRDLLDAKQVSWKYYSPKISSTGAVWNAFDAIHAVRYGPQWSSNVTTSDFRIFRDIRHHRLPAVSWLVPDAVDSDHPGEGIHTATGPSSFADLVNAIGESSYWTSTAIILIWDDWGGYYDHVPPPFHDHAGGLGFRVPMIVVSAYARKRYVAHAQYEFGSILKFIENNWSLGELGTTDRRARGIGGCFNFNAPPRKFAPFKTKYSLDYFERRPPSNLPVDTE